MNINGASILITGGAGCIGQQLVHGFTEAGAEIAVLEKDRELGEQLRQRFKNEVSVWDCDISDPVSVESALSQIRNNGFSPDVLINNAGVIHSEPLVNITKKDDSLHSVDSWRSVLSTNLDGVFYVTRVVTGEMVKRRCKGVVISLSSISAAGNKGQSAYSAAKAGVNALTKTWAKELGAFGLRFAAIAPGFIDTPSTSASVSKDQLQLLRAQIPLRKLGQAENVYLAARAIVENDYITGTIIEVDGGLVL